jgi:hypothetical protein
MKAREGNTMTMLGTLLLYVALLLPGSTAAQASYGQVIEAMARQAARLDQPQLMALVSDVGLQYLERAQWRERHPTDTLREVTRRRQLFVNVPSRGPRAFGVICRMAPR